MKPEQLTLARELLRLTQAQLALALDVHPQTISKWERGVVRLSAMHRRIFDGLLQPTSTREYWETGQSIRQAINDDRPDRALLALLTLSTAELRR